MLAYNGKILKVNLKRQEIEEETLDKELYSNYLGGSGLAARLFLDRLSAERDALSEDNPLIFMSGPLTGTRLPGCATRFSVVAQSPLTGIWGEASCGGSFGIQLKQAGFDGVILEGAASEPLYLWIDEGKVELRDAQALWGKDTYSVTDNLKSLSKETGKEVTVLAIGPAGEKKVLFANLVNDKGSVAGRAGLGAVMGSKNLKAICIRGSKKVDFANQEGLDNLRRELLAKMKENIAIQGLTAFGTDSAMDLGMMMGDVPTKNWQLGVWDEGGEKLSGPAMADTILVKGHACYGCPVACKRIVKVEEGQYKLREGPGPEYETVAALGTLCYNQDLNSVAKANEICNKQGMDTISCGATIAFAIECYEKGLLSENDTDGLKLNWGNSEAIVKLVEKIGKREGLGDLLAQGSKRAAQKIGKNAADFLVEVKGLEAPMHDPRAFHGMGLAYATSNRGACHVNSSQMWVEQGYVFYEELGIAGPYTEQESKGKAELNVQTQNLGSIFNSACICLFAGIPFSDGDILGMLNFSTGFELSLNEMMRLGERVWLLKRGINNLLGVTKADDRLPGRILTALSEGGAAGSKPDLELMLKEFYPLRGLSEQGRPEREKLESLGLYDLAKRLYG